jgi:excisionase family DNA binding protein
VKLYTTADVASVLGVKESTVRAYAARGQIPAPSGRVGRTPYWAPDDIEPWIATRNRAHHRAQSES